GGRHSPRPLRGSLAPPAGGSPGLRGDAGQSHPSRRDRRRRPLGILWLRRGAVGLGRARALISPSRPVPGAPAPACALLTRPDRLLGRVVGAGKPPGRVALETLNHVDG